MSALGHAVHLLPAGELFEQGYPTTPVAVCGEPVNSGPDDGEPDPRYCLKCVRGAAVDSAAWGGLVIPVSEDAPGVRGRIGVDPCPSCGATSGVQVLTDTPPKVAEWSCTECGTEWAITVVNPPRLFLDQLTGAVVLRQVIALADAAPALSDDQLRARLVELAEAARPALHPAGHRHG